MSKFLQMHEKISIIMLDRDYAIFNGLDLYLFNLCPNKLTFTYCNRNTSMLPKHGCMQGWSMAF